MSKIRKQLTREKVEVVMKVLTGYLYFGVKIIIQLNSSLTFCGPKLCHIHAPPSIIAKEQSIIGDLETLPLATVAILFPYTVTPNSAPFLLTFEVVVQKIISMLLHC